MNSTLLTTYTVSLHQNRRYKPILSFIENRTDSDFSRTPGKSISEAFDEFSDYANTQEDRLLLQISLDYRILYYYTNYPIEKTLAWMGACWCSSEKIGSFPYGPGPDDPFLSSRVIRRFFTQHNSLIVQMNPCGRKLSLADEYFLNRQCLVLGLFETIVHKGLFNCRSLPLFLSENTPTADLSTLPDEKLAYKMTRLSRRYCSEFGAEEIDHQQCLERKSKIPLASPLTTVQSLKQSLRNDDKMRELYESRRAGYNRRLSSIESKT